MQHIRIKYSVDKSEVDKSNASVQQAKVLTDNLKKSTQDLGNSGAKAFQQYQAPIEDAKIKMQMLRAQIDLTARSDTKRLNDLIAQYKAAKKQVDDFNKSLKDQPKDTSATKRINDLTNQYKQAKKQVDDLNKSLKDQQSIVKQNTVATQSLSQSFASMYSAIKLIVAAGLVRELVDASLEAAKLSGNVLAVGNAFRRQIPNAEVLLHNLQKATHNTVGEMELMQRALKFQNFGADVSKLPELLEFAAVRAQQTGESVDYLVNSIVNGIGRKSLLILDNLGISATRLKAEFGGASLQAQSVGDVTAAVGRIAKEELTKMGGYAETAATKVDQITVSFERLKKEVSETATSTGLLDFYNKVIKGVELMFRSFNTKTDFKELINIDKGQLAALNDFEKLAKRVNDERKKGNDIVERELKQNTMQILLNNEEIKSWEKKIETLDAGNSAEMEMIFSGMQAISHYQKQNAQLSKTNDLLVEYVKNLDRIAALEKEKKDSLGLIPNLENQIDALEELINGSTEGGNRVGGAKTRGEVAKLNRELEILKARLAEVKASGVGMIWDKDLKAWIDIEKIWKNIKKIDTKTVKQATKDFEDLETVLLDINRRINETENNPLPTSGGTNRAQFMAKQVLEAFQLAEEELTMGGIDIANNLGQSILDIELMNQEARLDNIRNFYDEQQNLAGNNSRYQAELRIKEDRETKKAQRELAISQRRARLYSIAIDTAASIAKAWVNPGWPGAIPLSAFLLAQGAVQASIVSRQPMGFKEGVIDLKGPGTTTSDSIPANLSRRESVMTANETMSSKGILMAIRSKTLDDAKLARIVGMNRGPVERQTDNSKLEKYLAEISKNTSGSNWLNNTGALIEAKREGNTTKRYNRSKFMYS